MKHRGIAVFAHVDRSSFSVLSNLGFIPEMDGVNALEISNAVNPEQFLMKHPALAITAFCSPLTPITWRHHGTCELR